MKLKSLHIMALITGLACVHSVLLNAQGTLRFRADIWYPFNGEPADVKPGYVVEILKTIYAKQGLEADYQVMPWKRAVAEGEKGTIHAVIGALKAETPNYVFPDEPIAIAANLFFVRKGSAWTYKGIESLRGKRLGIISGYSYGEKMDAYIKENDKHADWIDVAIGDSAVEQSIKKLKAGRIDIYVEMGAVFWATVEKTGMKADEFSEAGQANEPEPIYVAFSPKKEESKKLAQMFSDGLKELRKSGELAKILAKYSLKDWK